jgi:hypothetical protein
MSQLNVQHKPEELFHMGMDKASDKRVRLSQLQKAKIIKYCVKNPSVKYQLFSNGQIEEFKLGEAPSTSARYMWLKPETKKSLLDFLALQQAPRLMEMKGAYKSQHPELEEECFAWFKKNEAKQACIIDACIRSKAPAVGAKRGLLDHSYVMLQSGQ